METCTTQHKSSLCSLPVKLRASTKYWICIEDSSMGFWTLHSGPSLQSWPCQKTNNRNNLRLCHLLQQVRWRSNANSTGSLRDHSFNNNLGHSSEWHGCRDAFAESVSREHNPDNHLQHWMQSGITWSCRTNSRPQTKSLSHWRSEP